MTEACHCVAFQGWTIEHFHADDNPSVVVFHTPEHRSGSVTFHEAWGVDAHGETTASFSSPSEAVQFAARRYRATVSLGPDNRGFQS